MTFPETLAALLEGRDLGREESTRLMGSILEGGLAEAQIGGLLVAIQAKGGASAQELAGFASAMRASAKPMDTGIADLVDTCGTGGGPSTINLSTGAAIVAAAAGAKIAKHGNRAVTSRCGSADVLEALGVRLDVPMERLQEGLSTIGIAFLFAPNHHPAMRHVGPARKSLGVRTVFNQLGPLTNPAGASRQMVGVFKRDLLEPMAQALRLLGTQHAFVVHSEEGMDEVSPSGRTNAIEVQNGACSPTQWTPADFGIESVAFSEIAAGESQATAAESLRSALSGEDSSKARALVPNTAVALVLAGVAKDVSSGAAIAMRAINSGAAIAKLEELVQWTS